MDANSTSNLGDTHKKLVGFGAERTPVVTTLTQITRNELRNPTVQEPQDDLDELESFRSSTVSEIAKNVQQKQQQSVMSPIGT